MGRRKPDVVERLPLNGVSLSAYEIRLEEKAGHWVRLDLEPESDEEEITEEMIVEAPKPIVHTFDEHFSEQRHCIDMTGLPLATVVLDVSVESVHTHCYSSRLMDAKHLRIVKHFGTVKLVASDACGSRVFMGEADYWMGATEDLLCRLACLLSQGVVTMPFTFTETEIRYSIVVHARLLKEPKMAFQITYSNTNIPYIMEWLFPDTVSRVFPCKTIIPKTEIDIGRFFSLLARPKSLEGVQEAILAPFLHARLRPYQLRALYWMGQREGLFESENNLDLEKSLQSMFCHYLTSNGTPFFFCPFNSQFCLPSDSKMDSNMTRGGVLADEMGLGKTLVILALVLMHRMPALSTDPFEDVVVKNAGCEDYRCLCAKPSVLLEGGYTQCSLCGSWQHILCYSKVFNLGFKHVCLECQAAPTTKKLCVKTTLIVCPDSILTQWRSEIEKHSKIEDLKVLIYDGVKTNTKNLQAVHEKLIKASELGLSIEGLQEEYRRVAGCFLPTYLAHHDIVLTTYETLKADLHHICTAGKGSNHFNFREKKKYQIVPSALTSLEWFRICLDEAQEVESSTAAATEMAASLSAKYRWCVTGTPIGSRGLEDLAGLVKFVNVLPFENKFWWNNAVVNPLMHNDGKFTWKRVMHLFRSFIWRSTKKDVESELHLPGRTEHIHRLQLSPIEQHFYERKHIETKSSIVNAKNEASAFKALLQLRQACCHPQITFTDGQRRKNKKRLLDRLPQAAVEKGKSATIPMSLGDIHKMLISKAELEAEEEQRKLIMHMNAVAALQWIQDGLSAAKEVYQQILSLMSSSETEFNVKPDSLQRLHVAEGLRSLLRMESPNPMKGLHISQLDTKVKDIRDAFLRRYSLDVQASAQDCSHSIDLLGESRSCRHWWIEALREIQETSRSHIESLLQRLQLPFDQGGASCSSNPSRSIVFQFQTIEGMQHVLSRELDKIFEALDELLKAVVKIGSVPTLAEVTKSSNCGSCRSYFNKNGEKCQNCKHESTLTKFESLVFSFREQRKRTMMAEEEGNGFAFRAPCETRLALRVISHLFKSVATTSKKTEIVQGATQLENMFGAMGTLVGKARSLWRKKDLHLKAYDELDMATTRIQLVSVDEIIDKADEGWKVTFEQIPSRLLASELDVARARNDMKHAFSQLRYLKNLKNVSHRDSYNTTCTSYDGGTDNECCPICHDQFGDNFVVLPCGHSYCIPCVDKLKCVTSRSCPNCRRRFQVEEIRYVTTSNSKNMDQPKNIEKDSGLGTKINAVIREIVKLGSDAKCLVFSQWDEVLSIVEHGLQLNDIYYSRLRNRNKYNDKLMLFRSDPLVRVLLLPLRSGAKGLNLTEASHVFFVEPILNSAIEAQAIGRIHRMGQRNRCHVHFFVTSGTIEEKIHRLVRKKRFEASQKDQINQIPEENAPINTSREEEMTEYSAAINSKEKETISMDEIQSILF